MEETGNNRELSTQEELRSLLDLLAKSKLVDLLSRLGSQDPSIAEEIKRFADSEPVHRRLFVHRLAPETTSETLRANFEMHGEIERAKVVCDHATGKCLGYGFITYKHMESARSALRAPCKLIDGRMALHEQACGASTKAQKELYIGGLSPNVTDEMLASFFERHGHIEGCRVAYDKDTNASRGFGFVTYKTAEAARRAMDDPQKVLEGKSIIVEPAHTHKGKAVETQFSSAAVAPPYALPMAAPYALPMAPGYSQTVASYAYPSQPPFPYAPPPANYFIPQGGFQPAWWY